LDWTRNLSLSRAPAVVNLKRYGAFGGLGLAALAFLILGIAAKGPLVLFLVVFGLIGLGLAALMSPFAVIAEKERGKALVMNAQREAARMREQNQILESSKNESDQILSAVRAHLMVIDASYRIQSRYSTELENVFHQGDLGNENLLNIFQRLLSERLFKTSRDYLALLFDASKKERTVAKVNPLDEVEVTVTNPDGSAGLRYINFSFRRILDAGQIVKVLVSVEDTTDRTILERQLRESEQKKVKQFELLLGILHVEPTALTGFVTMANEQLAFVDEALRASDFSSAQTGQTALLRQRLDIVMQRVHNIKGNASLLRLEHFERQAQEFEQRIMDLKHRAALGGDDFLTVVIELAEFRGDLDDLQSLRAKLVGIQKSVATFEESGDPLVASVTELAQTLSKKYGKPVKIDADGFDSRKLPAQQRLVVKDVLIQLTRNSLVHGIESRDERRAVGKPTVATIELHPMIGASPDSFAFTFRDDGRGLDTGKIRSRAIASGLLDAQRAAGISDSDIAGFIFAPGFSTADTTTVDAGRGMGMNVVKQRVVDDCGGEIGIGSEAGRYCEFSFVVPMTPRVASGVK
jgi:HPt (histidine-containing phosphotransfer) domain-containing protein/PAS domain-containing protein